MRIPIVAIIAVSRLAALLVAVFCGYALANPEAVIGAATGPWLQTGLRLTVATIMVGSVGVAALYALLRHGPENNWRYVAFAVLLLPAFLFLPSLTRAPHWDTSLIVTGLLVLSAVSCLLPNPVQAWTALEPDRR